MHAIHVVLLLPSCSTDHVGNGGNIYDDTADEGDTTKTEKPEKVKMLWFDAEANFQLFSQKSNIITYLDLAKKPDLIP